MSKMLTKKSWKEFKDSGLLFVVNQFLHIFGYAIVFEYNDNNEIIKVYPARTKFRGFGEKQIAEGYKNISKYMKDNSEELLKESLE